jgi:Protein of unknown function C-terminus (DUF2399)
VRPWRLNAAAYDEAVATLAAESRLALGGRPVRTRWDEALARRMHHAGIAVHEESPLSVLLTDLAH